MKQIIFILVIVFGVSCTKDPYVEAAKVDPKRVLVDASHDGGVWWFPQGGVFDPNMNHQGKLIADLLKSKGFIVDELPRGAVIDASIFSKYDKVIRAGKYGTYTETELAAYKSLLQRPSSLLLGCEYLRPGSRDELAEMLGLKMAGVAKGYIQSFATHELTANVFPFYFNAGSVPLNLENKNIVPLGWLEPNAFADLNGNEITDPGEPRGPVALGILKHPNSKIFFIGDLNGIEQLPQPFMDNLLNWLFK